MTLCRAADPTRIRELARAELAQIEPTDREERRAAARELEQRPPEVQMWGQPALRAISTSTP